VRSQRCPVAEALLNRLDSTHFDVTSAGIEQGTTHPLTIELMKNIGIDLERKIAEINPGIYRIAASLL
jgi:protein-tyrosine-phosphatase